MKTSWVFFLVVITTSNCRPLLIEEKSEPINNTIILYPITNTPPLPEPPVNTPPISILNPIITNPTPPPNTIVTPPITPIPIIPPAPPITPPSNEQNSDNNGENQC